MTTLSNGQRIIHNRQIGNQADSDLSIDRPYFYSTYEIVGDREFVIFHRMIRAVESEQEKDSLVSKELYSIWDNGKIILNTH